MIIINFLDQGFTNGIGGSNNVNQQGLVISSLQKIGGDVNICFSCSNFSWHVSFQTNFVDFFNNLIMGLVLSANLGKNRDIFVNHPIRHYTSFTFLWLLISIIDWQFYGVGLNTSLCQHVLEEFFVVHPKHTLLLV